MLGWGGRGAAGHFSLLSEDEQVDDTWFSYEGGRLRKEEAQPSVCLAGFRSGGRVIISPSRPRPERSAIGRALCLRDRALEGVSKTLRFYNSASLFGHPTVWNSTSDWMLDIGSTGLRSQGL